MKKQIFETLALLSLLLVAGFAQAVSAQAPAGVVVSVPFEFVAGGERLPAGRYEIRRLSANSGKALMIRSLDGRKQTTVLTQAADSDSKAGQARLAFRRYGDLYFLAEVRTGETAGAREVPVTRAEKELRREMRERANIGEDEDCQTVVVVIGSAQ